MEFSALKGDQDRQTGVSQDFIAFAGMTYASMFLSNPSDSGFSIYWPDKLKYLRLLLPTSS
jgi:hypothetical protein